MRKLYSFLSGFSLFLFSFSVAAHIPSSLSPFQSLIERELPPFSILGAVVQDLHTGEILYEQRGKENFYPASNTKLFIAAAALKYLGEDFRFHTTLHAVKPNLIAEKLISDLYLVFSGDPSLTPANLLTLFQKLKTQGIKRIEGDLFIDDSAFSTLYYAPGWTWDSLPFGYSAPISAIIFNENKIKAKVTHHPPALQVQLLPSLPIPIAFKANLKGVTQEDAKHCSLNAHMQDNYLSLAGCWAINKTPVILEFALDNPRKLAQALIKDALKKNGIHLSGKISFKKMPDATSRLATHSSVALPSLLKEVLSESNNVYTESLTKTLGLKFKGEGSFHAGLVAMEAILTQAFSLSFTYTRFTDGSGQSRYNLFSPSLITQLLYHMRHDPTFKHFAAALSIGGQQGTLTSRFQEEKFIGKILAKTGTAQGTSALSGYLIGHSGKEYLFSLLINQATADVASLKKFEDSFCKALIETL